MNSAPIRDPSQPQAATNATAAASTGMSHRKLAFSIGK